MPNFSCGVTRPPSAAGERARELDRIAFDRDVDVEPLLAEKDVADGAADEVDGLGAIAERRHRIEQHTQALDALELGGKALTRLLAIVLDALERSQEIDASDDAHELGVSHHGHAAILGVRDEHAQLRERRVLGRRGRTPTHDSPHRRVRQSVGDRLVEILAAHRSDDAAAFGDEHSALSVALTQRHRVADGVLGLDRPRGRRHDVAGAARLLRGMFERRDHQPARVAELRPKDGRGGLSVSSATEGGRNDGGVHEIAAAAYDREHSLLHLDEEHERLRVGEVDDLVREVRDPVHVRRPPNGCEQELLPAGADRLERLEQVVEEIALTR